MSARDEILGRVRTALADVPTSDPAQDVPVTWQYGRATPMDDVLDRFVERVSDYQATVVRVGADEDEVGQAIMDALTQIGASDAVLPSGAPQAWAHAIEAAGLRIVRDEPPLSNRELNDVGAVVTACRVGAAESGTIMLDHAEDQGRRALTLVPDVHVCVVRADQVVSDVPEAVARLGDSVAQRRTITWISGPSATSDIELIRVEGVHGPRTLWVVLAAAG